MYHQCSYLIWGTRRQPQVSQTAIIVLVLTPFGTHSYPEGCYQQAMGPADHKARESIVVTGWICCKLQLWFFPLCRDHQVLLTSCCLFWLISAMTLLSCRKRYSGTGLTLQQRSSLYLRSYPATQRPRTSALEMTTQEELMQEIWELPETSSPRTFHLFTSTEKRSTFTFN